MKVSFSGHRDKLAKDDDIISLLMKYPNASVIHGGAKGFDSQVHSIATILNRQIIVIPPSYNLYGKKAPIIRNRHIVEIGDMLVALYDGRKYGGTLHTINIAKYLNKPIVILHPFTSS